MRHNKRFRRVYLHAGLGKTGTSTIQSYLAANAVRIEREYDIHFPHVFDLAAPFAGNHSELLRTIATSEVEPLNTHTLPTSFAVNGAGPSAEEVRLQFERGFSDSQASQLLISAEAVGHFDSTKMMLLASWLGKYSDSVEVIACIRHPAAALSSEIQQRLRFGAVLKDLYEYPPYYSFRGLLPRLETAFPGSHVVLYDFDTASRCSSGIVGTFLQKIGIEESLRGGAPRPMNPSMSQYGAMLLSALNDARSCGDTAFTSKGGIPNDVAPFLRIPGRKFQAVPRAYERLEQVVERDLLWLEREYGLSLTRREINFYPQEFFFGEPWMTKIALAISACYSAFCWCRALGKK